VPAGVTAVIEVALTKTTLVAGASPMVTMVKLLKPVPVMVTGVPPDVEPEAGTMDDTASGGTMTVKPPVRGSPVAPGMITETSLGPGVALDAMVIVAVIRVALTTLNPLAVTPAPLKFTALTPERLLPLTITPVRVAP